MYLAVVREEMNMISSYTGVVENAASTSAAAVEAKKKTEQTQNEKSGSVSGKTIGSPKLSKKAADYYESLKTRRSRQRCRLPVMPMPAKWLS